MQRLLCLSGVKVNCVFASSGALTSLTWKCLEILAERIYANKRKVCKLRNADLGHTHLLMSVQHKHDF